MTTKKKERIQKIVVSLIAAIIVLVIVANSISHKQGNKVLRQTLLSTPVDLTDKSSKHITYEQYKEQHGAATDNLSAVITVGGEELISDENGDATCKIQVEKAGYYELEADYYVSTDTDKSVRRDLYINGEIPYTQAESVDFQRAWVLENKDFLMKNDRNYASPALVQGSEMLTETIEAADKSVDGPLLVWLDKGENTISFHKVEGDMELATLRVKGSAGLKSYADFLEAHKDAEKVKSTDLENGSIIVQAEDLASTSLSMIVPQNDRTSPLTMPHHSSNIVMNTIGGKSWADAGATINWEVTVPKSGLYHIATRYAQTMNRDFYSIREVKVNGKVPFAEASLCKFPYKNGFQMSYLSDEAGEPFYFYLEEGKNILSMTVNMGDMSYAYLQTKISVKAFNNLYRELTAVMGSSPDPYRDYAITTMVPDMEDVMKTEYYRLSTIVESLGDTVESSTKTREIAKMLLQLEDLIETPDKISKQLSTFNDNITAISEWMLSLDSQPLTLDYLLVTGDGAELPKAEGNFFQKFGHGFMAFIGSFTNDYQIGERETAKDQKKIEVWIATATRDQYDVLEKLIERSFDGSTYQVDLKMVGADTVMPATLTGNGPDVALQLNYTMPTNFAYRHAGYDLTQFSDFKEVADRFPQAGMEYFEYEGGYYALPDMLSYPVLFYRKDILEQMNLDVPETWEDLEAMIPYLQADNMSCFFTTTGYRLLGGQSSTSTKPVNAVFNSLLYQNGMELYTEDNTKSTLSSNEALMTFKKWTEYYTKQNFEQTISVVTRFRTGQTPLIIEDYTYILDIMAAAPEIDGLWGIAPIPGTKQADGTVDHTATATVSGSMILKNSVEKNGTAEEAWDFLKWWTSKETQSAYSKELRSVLGDAGTVPVANTEAALETADNLGLKAEVETAMQNLRGVPQVPGGYISGRYVENSFLEVYNDNTDPVDTLYKNIHYIDQEISNKRKEFGLTK